MISRARVLCKKTLTFCLTFTLASCTLVQTTGFEGAIPLSPDQIGFGRFKCRSDVGTYALSKSLLTASITYDGATAEGQPSTGPIFNGFGIKRKADPDHSYCFQYTGLATSDERVRVEKTDEGVLKLITGTVKDQSGFAIEEAVETLFLGAVNAGTRSTRDTARPGKKELKFVYEMDPFDFMDVAQFNDRANDFGYCAVLPGFSFNAANTTIDQYCNDPLWVVKEPGKRPNWGNAQTTGVPSNNLTYPKVAKVIDQDLLQGILYRPRFPYPVFVMEKLGHRWVLKERSQIMMENISPILSVSVERRLFAARNSVFQFDEGALENTCIYNSAGISEVVKIPLAIAQAIVSLPTEIFQVNLGNTQASTELAKVEAQILNVQTAILKEADLPSTTAGKKDILISDSDIVLDKDNVVNPFSEGVNAPLVATDGTRGTGCPELSALVSGAKASVVGFEKPPTADRRPDL